MAWPRRCWATPPLQHAAVPVRGEHHPSSAAFQADGTRAVATILGLLSMAAALIHCAVIEQHRTEY